MPYSRGGRGPRDPGRGLRFDPDDVLLEPYGRGFPVPPGYDRQAAASPGDNAAVARKSVVADLRGYEWEGDAPLHRPFSQTVIYEMHVDGFRFDLVSILSGDEAGQPLVGPPVLLDIETDSGLAGVKLIAGAWWVT